MSGAVMREEAVDPIVEILKGVNLLRDRVAADSARALVWGIMPLAKKRFDGDVMLALTGAPDRQSKQLRDVAIYLAHTIYGLSHEAVGDVVDLHRSAASRAIARIEEARDDAVFNWKLEQVEMILKQGGR